MSESSLDHEPMRIALVITELEVGGAERCLAGLATGLKGKSFAPIVYSLAPRPETGSAALVDELEGAGVPVRFVGVRHDWQFFTAVRRLGRLLTEQSPALVQTFLFHANIVGALAARRAGVGRVVAGIRVAERGRWRWWAQRVLSGRIDQFVCVSRPVAELAKQRGRIPADKLSVIPNGIDAARLAAAEAVDLSSLGVPSGRRAILFVGRLDRQKGADWLVRLAPQLLQRLPGHDLVLVGSGPQLAELKSLCQSLGIAERVHFPLFRTDVAEILGASDLLVLPSRWEGMPNVLLEAMAAGRPVVASNVEGVDEVLGPLAADQAVPPGDADAFLKRVVQLAEDTEWSSRLGSQNRQRVQQHFTLDSMIDAYRKIYKTLLAPKTPENPGE